MGFICRMGLFCALMCDLGAMRDRLTPSRRLLFACSLLAAAPGAGASHASAQTTEIPFIGCASNGMMGPVAAPASNGNTPNLSSVSAGQLAYYASAALGVIAPRGWNCFGLYGSGGAILLVTPERHDAADLFRDDVKISGSVIEVSRIFGSTSGRFEVARLAARLFPVAKSFVQSVIDEDIEPAADFPFTPFSTDTLTRRSPTVVEYLSPGDTEGLGTAGLLAKDGQPISGAVILLPEEYMNLINLDVRLPAELHDLLPTITKDILTTKGEPRITS